LSARTRRLAIIALLVVMALLGVAALAARDWLYVVVDVAAVAYLALRLRQQTDDPPAE
jgi:hypothetical protein